MLLTLGVGPVVLKPSLHRTPQCCSPSPSPRDWGAPPERGAGAGRAVPLASPGHKLCAGFAICAGFLDFTSTSGSSVLDGLWPGFLDGPRAFPTLPPPPPSRARVPLESRVGNSTQIFPSQQASDSGTDADEQSVSGEASGKLRGWQSNTSWVARIRITQILEL